MRKRSGSHHMVTTFYKSVLSLLLCTVWGLTYAQDERTVNELLETNQRDTAIVWTLKSKSFKYSFINTDTSKLLAQKAIEIARKIKYPLGVAISNITLGIAYNTEGDSYSALKHFIKSRDIYDSLNDERRVAQAMSYCALIYGALDQIEKALETRSRIVPIQTKLKDTKGLAYSFVNIAFLHTNINLLDSALIYYQKCLVLFDSLNDEYGLALTHHGLGRVNKKLGNDKKTIEYINTAIDLFKKHEVNEQLAAAYNDLADLYEKQDSMNLAYSYYNSGIQLARDINAKILLMEFYKGLYGWHKKMGQKSEALKYYELHISLKDSVFSDKHLKDLEILQARENEIAMLNENNILKQKELVIETKFRNFLLAGIFSILILSIFLFRNYRINVRHNKELRDQHLEIEEKNKEILIEKEHAYKASAIKTQFLTTMSHEIRTPLNAVIGHSHLLQQQKPRQDQEEHLKALSFAGEHLLILVNDILDFSKFEAGKISFDETDFNLPDMVNAIKHILVLRAKEKSIDFTVQIDSDVPKILFGDATRLAQILNNLLSNAIKFTEKGSVQLDVDVEKVEDDIANIKFNVVDTGIGIPESRLSDIFKSFEQVSAAISTKYGGTGLGLAITKKLVEQQGGNIYVESTQGVGSRFYFTIPYKLSKKSSEKVTKYQHEATFQSLQGIKVLVAEDNPMNEVLCSKFLKNWGIEREVAHNGLEAVEWVQNKDFDLILMDLQMPEMDGFEATKKIRTIGDGKYLDLPIIALTAATMPETKDRVKSSGMVDFISKPFNPNELYLKIEKYTIKKRMLYT